MTFLNRISLILIVFYSFTNISEAQSFEGKYFGRYNYDRAILTLESDGQFEFLIDADDCTPDYFYIGEGHYFVECDSLFLEFNLLPPNGKKAREYWMNTTMKIEITSMCELRFHYFLLKKEHCLLYDIKNKIGVW
jgi:hypothetical protein